MKAIFLIGFYILLFVSCHVNREFLEDVIHRDAIEFDDSKLPDVFLEKIRSSSIILLGETHYVQEHSEFLQRLIESEIETNVEIVLMQEQPSCFNWLVEDYVTGKIDSLPQSLVYFDGNFLDKLKFLNSTNAGNSKFRYRYMDVNHGKSFLSSLMATEHILGEQSDFSVLKNVDFDSQHYKDALLTIIKNLDESPGAFKDKWGEKWYSRYSKMFDQELSSLAYRNSKDESVRERFMFNFIKEQRAINDKARLIINCGMNHAQKDCKIEEARNQMGSWLLEIYYGEVYSIVFIGLKGETKMGHWYNMISTFDLTKSSKKNAFIEILANKSNNRTLFLDLKDPIFMQKMSVSYHYGESYYLKPFELYDAIIAYPEVHILNTMKERKFEEY